MSRDMDKMMRPFAVSRGFQSGGAATAAAAAAAVVVDTNVQILLGEGRTCMHITVSYMVESVRK